MKMNCETGGENCQIKVNAGERCEPERDRKQIQSLHSKIIRAPP